MTCTEQSFTETIPVYCHSSLSSNITLPVMESVHPSIYPSIDYAHNTCSEEANVATPTSVSSNTAHQNAFTHTHTYTCNTSSSSVSFQLIVTESKTPKWISWWWFELCERWRACLPTNSAPGAPGGARNHKDVISGLRGPWNIICFCTRGVTQYSPHLYSEFYRFIRS